MKITLVAASLLLFAAEVRAGWQGTLAFHQDLQAVRVPQSTGAIHVEGDKVRIDQSLGNTTHATIYEGNAGRMIMLLPGKLYQSLAVPADLPHRKGPPACAGKAEECLTAMGFSKAGTEALAGHPCSIWRRERTESDGVVVEEKIWRPDDVAELAFLRQTLHSKRGDLAVEVRSFHVGAQDPALFAVPKDYADRRTVKPARPKR